MDKDKKSRNEYLINNSILFVQKNNFNNLNLHIVIRFSKVLSIHLSMNTVVIEDGLNNKKIYPTKYLNNLSLFELLPFNLELKFGCSIIILQNIV